MAAKKPIIALGVDHAGFSVKKETISLLAKKGFDVVDVGTDSNVSVDYPDFAYNVAKLVAGKKAQKGILICGSGTGMSMVANKVKGIRAASVWSPATARLSVEHNWSNVLCLSARFSTRALRARIINAWLKAKPVTGGRHERRVKKIRKIESKR